MGAVYREEGQPNDNVRRFQMVSEVSHPMHSLPLPILYREASLTAWPYQRAGATVLGGGQLPTVLPACGRCRPARGRANRAADSPASACVGCGCCRSMP